MTLSLRRVRDNLSPEVALRVVADIILVNAGLIIGLVVRLALLTASQTDQDDTNIDAYLADLAKRYMTGAPLVTVTAITCFSTAGFYTRGRFYESRYKLLLITQATTLAYLLFGFTNFFFSLTAHYPRSALLSGWAATIVLVAGARLWSEAWRFVVRKEDREAQSYSQGRSGILGSRSGTVLVIGGAGYIGSVLCRRLLSDGYTVRVLDALFYGDGSVQALKADRRFELVRGDTRDIAVLVAAMRGVNAVIHMGEVVGDPATELDERLTLEINVAASRMIAEVAAGNRIPRFIYVSSCSVYGAAESLLDEQSAAGPLSLYAKAKVEAERALRLIHPDRFQPTILRLGTVYGLSPRPRFDLVVNLLAARATVERKVTIHGGQQWRPFVHVADVADAIKLVLEANISAVGGEIFNVGSNQQNLTLIALGESVCEVIPNTVLELVPGSVDQRNYRVDFTKLQNRLGFSAKRTIPDGVREISNALVSGTVDDFTARRYSNYKTLGEDSELLDSLRNRRINDLFVTQR